MNPSIEWQAITPAEPFRLLRMAVDQRPNQPHRFLGLGSLPTLRKKRSISIPCSLHEFLEGFRPA
jgi:hypothetical protein